MWPGGQEFDPLEWLNHVWFWMDPRGRSLGRAASWLEGLGRSRLFRMVDAPGFLAAGCDELAFAM